MNTITKQPRISSINSSFLSLFIFLALTYLVILFNVPVLRQLLAFCFLTFVPGILILRILKINQPGFTEKLVLAVGLSVTFVMFAGLLVNTIGPLVHYNRPLDTNSLLISFGIITLVLGIIAYFRNRTTPLFSLTAFNLSLREKAFLLIPSLFPLLSIWGMRIMDANNNNILLMILLFLIPVYCIVIIIIRRQFTERIFPAVLLLIGLSVLLLETLRSPYLIGSDIHSEYGLFQLTYINAHWQAYGAQTLDSCLSISLLPAIYQSFLNIDSQFLFKALYPILFSVAPLVVYIISRKYINSTYAFLASFFFMSQVTFVETAGSARISLAILFFGLAIMVLFTKNLSEFPKRLLFILFSVSCIVSHYSTTFVFFFALLFTWFGFKLVTKISFRRRKTPTENVTGIMITPQAAPAKKGISPGLVALFLVLLFFWYSQVTLSAFSAGVSFVSEVISNLRLGFTTELKGPTVTAALGANINSISQIIRVVFSWLGVALIAIGVLSTLWRSRKMINMPHFEQEKPNILSSKFDLEYLMLALVCGVILLSAFILPWISLYYGMERIHFQTLAVLSVFFVIGCTTVAGWIRTKIAIVLLVAIIPLFMCVTGTMYQVFGTPASILLNSEGLEYQLWYVHDQDVYAARWLAEYRGAQTSIYAGSWPGPRVIVSQGGIPANEVSDMFTDLYDKGANTNGYVYLRYFDINMNPLPEKYTDVLGGKNKIYISNGAEVLR